MNHMTSSSKFYLGVIVLMLTVSGVLIAVNNTRMALQYGLQELAKIKDDFSPVNARPSGPSSLEELAEIKDDLFPVSSIYPNGPSRLEKLTGIKDDLPLVNARPTGPSWLEELEHIKNDLVH